MSRDRLPSLGQRDLPFDAPDHNGASSLPRKAEDLLSQIRTLSPADILHRLIEIGFYADEDDFLQEWNRGNLAHARTPVDDYIRFSIPRYEEVLSLLACGEVRTPREAMQRQQAYVRETHRELKEIFAPQPPSWRPRTPR